MRLPHRAILGLTLSALALVSVGGCGGKAPALSLRVESRVSPIDRVTARAYAATGALTDETPFPSDGKPTLPGVISIETGAHTGALRFFVWGWSNGARVAFSSVTVTVEAGKTAQATAVLEAFGTDSDADGVPNAVDNCPTVANETQADGDGAAPGDACTTDGGSDGGVFCPGNFFPNGTFETGVGGWFTDAAGNPKPSLAQVSSERPDGGSAARICHLGGGTSYISFYFPAVLPVPSGGKRYSVVSQVRRSPPAADGGSFSLGVFVRATNDAGTKLNETTSPVSLGSGDVSWHSLSGNSMAPGTGVVAQYDVYFAIDFPPAGACFDVDDVCVTQVP